MRELPIVLIALGFAVMLTGGLLALWASFQIGSLELVRDISDEWDEWDSWYYPYTGLDDEEIERQQDRYSAIRTAGVIGMIAGILVALYGIIVMRKESELVAPGASAPSTISGAVNFCEYCGRQLSPGAVRCPGCGRAFQQKGHEVGNEQEVR